MQPDGLQLPTFGAFSVSAGSPWQLTVSDLQHLPSSQVPAFCESASAPVILTPDAPARSEPPPQTAGQHIDEHAATQEHDAAQASPFRLFESVSLHRASAVRRNARQQLEDDSIFADASTAQGQHAQKAQKLVDVCNCDAAAFAGGVVWCAAFAPSPSQPSPPILSPQTHIEYVAVGVHNKNRPRNRAGAPLPGPGAIQLWGIPHSDAAPGYDEGLPICRFLLSHGGSVTWDLSWCPVPLEFLGTSTSERTATTPAAVQGAGSDVEVAVLNSDESTPQAQAGPSGSLPANSKAVPLLGLLAAVLGDGTVELFSVPHPAAMPCELQPVLQPPSAPQHTPGNTLPSEADVQGSSDAAQTGHVSTQAEAANAVAAAAAAAGPGSSILQPPLLRLRPRYVLRPLEQFGAAPSCCDWQHTYGRRRGAGRGGRLLLGCWDGSALAYWLPAHALERLQPLFHMRVDALALRRVRWLPNPPPPPSTSASTSQGRAASGTHASTSDAAGKRSGPGNASGKSNASEGQHSSACVRGVDSAHAYMFATVGGAGRLKMFDIRFTRASILSGCLRRLRLSNLYMQLDPSMPVMQRMIHRSSISDFVLEPGTTDPEAPMASATLVGEDGVLRQVFLSGEVLRTIDESAHSFRELVYGALCSVSICPPLRALLYGGETGSVGLMCTQTVLDSRMRMPHAGIAGLVCDAETGVLELLSAAQLLGQPELYAGGSSTRAKQLPPPPRGAQPTVAEVLLPRPVAQTMHVVRWSTQVMGDSAWMVAGYNCGILRFVRVSMVGVPLTKAAAGAGAAPSSGKRAGGS